MRVFEKKFMHQKYFIPRRPGHPSGYFFFPNNKTPMLEFV